MAAAFVAAGLASPARAQEPAPKPVPAEAAKLPTRDDLIRNAEEFIKPLPLEPIPDDPPPHEGAMIELSYRVEPPDLVLVEVLEALPGRPITGERLVKPDGNIDLGFYGEVNVVGLTPKQIKAKVILHLRPFLTDQTLGLVRYDETGILPGNAQRPPDPFPDLPPPEGFAVPDLQEPPGRELFSLRIDGDAANAGGAAGYTLRFMLPRRPEPAGKAGDRPDIPPLPRDFPPIAPIPKPIVPRPEDKPVENVAPALPGGQRYVYVRPEDSLSVFVDAAVYNSKVYYVQGDLGSPGRLTFTGRETVLDALQYAGGLLPSADPKKIRLFRPARGGKPVKEYLIDLLAIERGDKKANLQIFPGDRLVVERKANLPAR